VGQAAAHCPQPVAVRCDGRCGTKIEAARATSNLRARMCAKRGVVADVTRLLEGAGKVARFQHRPQHRGGVAGIGTQIAVAQIGCGEERHPAGQIKNDIAARSRIVARWPERQYAARGRRGSREIVDHQLERAEMAFGVSDLSLRHRKIGYSRRHDRGGRFNQDRDVEMIPEQVAGFDSGFIATTDQNDAAAFELNQWHSRRGFGRRRKQRGHFRPGSGGLAGPSGRLPDIGKLDWACACAFPNRLRK
jgi:hypothetical protein